MNIKSFFYLLSTMTVLGCSIVMQGAATSVKGDGVITLVNNTTVPLNIRIGDIPAIRIESKKAFLLNRALFTKQDLTELYLTTQDLGLPASQELLLDDIDVNSFATGIIVKFTPSLTKKKTLEYTLEESEELKAERDELEENHGEDLAAWLEENHGKDLAAWCEENHGMVFGRTEEQEEADKKRADEELARAKEDAKALSQEIIQHLKAVSTDCMALAQRLR